MLTHRKCKTAICQPDKSRVRFADAGGLYLQVTPAGSKRWFLKYRKGDKEMRMALGSYPLVSLANARVKQSEAKALKHKGMRHQMAYEWCMQVLGGFYRWLEGGRQGYAMWAHQKPGRAKNNS